MSSKSAQAVKDLENRFFIQRKVYQALVRSRLYSSGALVIGVDQGNPEEELDLDKVGQGDLKSSPSAAGCKAMEWLRSTSTQTSHATNLGLKEAIHGLSGDRQTTLMEAAGPDTPDARDQGSRPPRHWCMGGWG
jgi:hypothetical protein